MTRAERPWVVDLSHTIEHGLVTYRGLPAPVITDHLSRELSRAVYTDGTEFHIGKIEMVANTGTYLDTPFHRYADGADLSELALEDLVDLPAVLVRAPFGERREVDASLFAGRELSGRAVLVATGWDVHWATDAYFEDSPYLTADAARLLRDAGAKLVGIDSLNIDDTRDRSRPVHSILLAAGIPIVEHLCNMGWLPEEGFLFEAVPPKVKGFGTFPVRALAKARCLHLP